MKLVINNKEYNVDLTEHKTTQDEQLKVFFDEADEFNESYYKYNILPTIKYKEDVAQECIDCIKSLAKYIGYNNKDVVKLISFRFKESTETIDRINDLLHDLQMDNDLLYGTSLLQTYTNFLYLFCKENNLNITEQFQINNEKTNGRGTKKKVYLSDEEIADLIENSNKLLNCGFPELAQKQQNIIDKIEG